PATAATAVQVYVSKVRKALAGALGAETAARLLETRAPGYVLNAEAEQLDSERLERLAREGSAALAAGDAAAAPDLLAEALALRRGPPLGEFATEEFAVAEAARLEEEYLAALEERIEAELALGRHLQLVGGLEALVSAHPWRERLRGQLMLALYRSGRQSE